MASQYDEEHFTSVSFPIYSIKSCCESHSKFVLILNLCKFIKHFYAYIKMLHFLGSISYFIESLFSQLSNEV